MDLYSGDAETEARFFLILVLGCLAPWAISGGLVILWNRARKRRVRGGMSGSGLL